MAQETTEAFEGQRRGDAQVKIEVRHGLDRWVGVARIDARDLSMYQTLTEAAQREIARLAEHLDLTVPKC